MVKRMALLTVGTLIVFMSCQMFMKASPTPNQPEKSLAAAEAARAQSVIGQRLVGPEFTMITTTLAPRQAKTLSLHPDFAAVAVGWLAEAGVKPGSRVAVNLSGSFPALNIAVLSAIRAMGAEAVITSSVGASTWGATDPEYTWLDIEPQLQAAGFWAWRSSAASLGGVGDRGGGMTPEGKMLALAVIDRNGVPLLDPPDLKTAVARRLEIYRDADGHLPPVLVNVGGGHVIFGKSGHRSPLPQGLNIGYHPLLAFHDGLAAAFLQSNRPVIHFINLSQMAAQYGISAGTQSGASGAFLSRQLPLPLRIPAALWLLGVLAILWNGRPQKDL